MSMRRFLPRVVLALLLVAAIAWVAVHREQINLETLDSWLASLGSWAPIGYMIIFALATVAFAPGAIFSLIGGALFGPVWGSLWNLLGATLGATLAFLAARYIVGDWVRHKAGGLLKRLIDGVDAEGWRFVAFVRLVPLFPFNLSNYVLGLTRIPLRQYVLATFVCMAPGAVAYTWLGYAGRGALAGETNAVRYGLLALGLLAAIASAATADRAPAQVILVDRGWRSQAAARRRRSALTSLTYGELMSLPDLLGHIAAARNIPVAELEWTIVRDC